MVDIKKLARNVSVQNMAITIIAKGLGFLLSLYAVRILSTESYGDFVYVVLILSYIPLAQLGVFQGLYLTYPDEKVAKNKKAFEYFTDLNLVSTLIIAISALCLFLIDFGLSKYVIWGLYFNAILERYIENKYIHLSTFLDFDRLNIIKVFREILIPVTRFFVLYRFASIELFLLCPLAVNLMVLPYVYFVNQTNNFMLSEKFKENLRRAYQVGFPVFCLSAMDIVFISADRFFVSQFYSKTELARYGFFSTLSMSLYLVIASYLAPKIQLLWNKIAEDGAVGVVPMLKKFRVQLLKITLVFTTGLSIVFPILIDHVIQKHKGHNFLFYCLVMVSILFCLNLLNINYILGRKKSKVLVKLQSQILILNVSMNSLIAFYKMYIEYFAIATIITLIFYLIRCQRYVYKDMQSEISEGGTRICK